MTSLKTVRARAYATIGAFLLLILGTAPGCSNPCEEISELACQKGGEESPECKKARETAANASVDEKAACETVLGLVQSVNKQ